MTSRYPVTLVMNPTANGETVECFLEVDGRPVYPNETVGVFMRRPSPSEALKAVVQRMAKP